MSDTSKAVKSLERTILLLFVIVVLLIGIKALVADQKQARQSGAEQGECFVARIDAGLPTEDC